MKKTCLILLFLNFSTFAISSDPIIERAFPLFHDNLSELGKNKIVENIIFVGCENWDQIVSVLIEKNIKTQTAVGYSNLVRSLNPISHKPLNICKILDLLETTQIKKEIYSVIINALIQSKNKDWPKIIDILNLCNPSNIAPYSLQNLVHALSKTKNFDACQLYVEENSSLKADLLAGRILRHFI